MFQMLPNNGKVTKQRKKRKAKKLLAIAPSELGSAERLFMKNIQRWKNARSISSTSFRKPLKKQKKFGMRSICREGKELPFLK